MSTPATKPEITIAEMTGRYHIKRGITECPSTYSMPELRLAWYEGWLDELWKVWNLTFSRVGGEEDRRVLSSAAMKACTSTQGNYDLVLDEDIELIEDRLLKKHTGRLP